MTHEFHVPSPRRHAALEETGHLDHRDITNTANLLMVTSHIKLNGVSTPSLLKYSFVNKLLAPFALRMGRMANLADLTHTERFLIKASMLHRRKTLCYTARIAACHSLVMLPASLAGYNTEDVVGKTHLQRHCSLPVSCHSFELRGLWSVLASTFAE